jgi:hypothetical protein
VVKLNGVFWFQVKAGVEGSWVQDHHADVCPNNDSTSGGRREFDPAYDRCGSKCENLAVSMCRPVYPKAWSQNLRHENVLKTFSSYGDVARGQRRNADTVVSELGRARCAWITWSAPRIFCFRYKTGMSRLFRTYRAPLSQCATT